MMSKELDIRPYTPLLQGEGQLENLEVRNLPKELTDDLIAMHIEGELEENEVSSAEYKCKSRIRVFFNITSHMSRDARKIGLWGFRPGLTQTVLYKHRG